MGMWPLRARRPTAPEPGTTSCSVVVEDVRAFVDVQARRAVGVVAAARSRPAARSPTTRRRRRRSGPGGISARRRLVAGRQDGPTRAHGHQRRDVVARRDGASSSSSRGRAMASPTTTRMFTASVPTRRQAAAGSKRPPGSVTTLPPPNSMVNASQWALACMNGGQGSAVMPGRITRVGQLLGRCDDVAERQRRHRRPWRRRRCPRGATARPLGMPVVPPV